MTYLVELRKHLDYEQVVGAIRDLAPLVEFARLAASLEQKEQ